MRARRLVWSRTQRYFIDIFIESALHRGSADATVRFIVGRNYFADRDINVTQDIKDSKITTSLKRRERNRPE